MSPRAYRMEKRQAGRNETRARILDSVRELLSNESITDLSMDAVARRADVSRLTIYYQFGSRAGLLEALYDHLAERGHMHRMTEVFQEPEAARALAKMVRTFVGFWAADASVMRWLRAMAALDPEIARGIHARDARRPRIAGEVLTRSLLGRVKTLNAQQRHATDVVGMLTSFETYDVLARAGHSADEIVATITSLVHCVMEPILGSRSQRTRGRPPAKATNA